MSTPAPSLSPSAREAVANALALLHAGRFEEAAYLHARVSEDFPADPEVAFLEAELATSAGDLDRALDAIVRAAGGAVGSLTVMLRRADLLASLGRRAEAMDVAEGARALAGSDPRVLWALGRLHARCGDPLEAKALYAEAARSLDDPALLNDLGTAEFFAGDGEAAEAAFGRVLGKAPNIGHAAYLRSTSRRQTPERNHVASLRAAIAGGALDDENRAAYLYALAKELEDLGEYQASFEALVEGAALKRSTLRHDAASEREAIASIGATFDAATMATLAGGEDGEGAIFIVGMPRTGTTLLEHLLARHARVPSAGELPDFGQALARLTREQLEAMPGATPVEAAVRIDYAELGRRYMHTARQAAGGADRFVDKMPVNFMYCGMIAKALPRATILHLVRDPMDTCYAVFKTLFANAYPFSYDQDELAQYYLAYRALMAHWHAAMPGRILDVQYEDLVSDPDRELRRVLDACGLEWQPATDDTALSRASMTASALQVRAPVHTGSVGKWALHAEGLAPIRRRLEAAGIDVG